MTSSPVDVWRRVLDALKSELPEQNLDLWLQHVRAQTLEDGVLRLEVPNRFYSEQLRRTIEPRIQQLLEQYLQSKISVAYSFAPEGPAAEQGPAERRPETPPPPVSESFPEINPRYTFDNFVVGPSNRFSHAMAQAVAKEPGKNNPLVIYGGVGLGKTHLMCAIGHALRRGAPRARVLYATAEQFFNEFVDAISKNRVDAFRAKYRGLDCLLMDDVQFLINRGRSEEEFTHTFNTLFESRKQIVITSDRAPSEMTPMEKRLISRLDWGVVTDIKAPDLETRIAILRRKAEADGYSIPDDVINYIAGAIRSNIRQLEGSLSRVAAYADMLNLPASVDMAKDLLKDVVSLSESSGPVAVETIQRLVAQRYSVDVRDLKSKQRTEAVAFPRQLAMYLCLTLAGKSTTEVGDLFGNRDHSTVIHARNKIKARLDSDPFFNAQVNKIIEDIRAAESL